MRARFGARLCWACSWTASDCEHIHDFLPQGKKSRPRSRFYFFAITQHSAAQKARGSMLGYFQSSLRD